MSILRHLAIDDDRCRACKGAGYTQESGTSGAHSDPMTCLLCYDGELYREMEARKAAERRAERAEAGLAEATRLIGNQDHAWNELTAINQRLRARIAGAEQPAPRRECDGISDDMVRALDAKRAEVRDNLEQLEQGPLPAWMRAKHDGGGVACPYCNPERLDPECSYCAGSGKVAL